MLPVEEGDPVLRLPIEIVGDHIGGRIGKQEGVARDKRKWRLTRQNDRARAAEDSNELERGLGRKTKRPLPADLETRAARTLYLEQRKDIGQGIDHGFWTISTKSKSN
jgi:hypothetical protein